MDMLEHLLHAVVLLLELLAAGAAHSSLIAHRSFHDMAAMTASVIFRRSAVGP